MFTSLALLCHREENKKDCICFPSSLNSQRPLKLKGFRMMIAELDLSGNQDWRLTTPLYWLVGGILPLLLTGNVNCIGSGRHNIIIISDYRHDIVYYFMGRNQFNLTTFSEAN